MWVLLAQLSEFGGTSEALVNRSADQGPVVFLSVLFAIVILGIGCLYVYFVLYPESIDRRAAWKEDQKLRQQAIEAERDTAKIYALNFQELSQCVSETSKCVKVILEQNQDFRVQQSREQKALQMALSAMIRAQEIDPGRPFDLKRVIQEIKEQLEP